MTFLVSWNVKWEFNFSWNVKAPIYFPWNMILILSSSPHPPPLYHHVISSYGKYDCIVSPILNLHTAPKLRPIFSALISKTHALHTHKTFIQSNSMTVLLDQTNFNSSFATSHLGTSANLPWERRHLQWNVWNSEVKGHKTMLFLSF